MPTPSLITRPFFGYMVIALLFAGCVKVKPEEPAEPPNTPAGAEHLALGNPSGATSGGEDMNNFLLSKYEYALGYNNSRGTASWVSWHLSSNWLGNAERCDCFLPDPGLPDGYFVADTWDYIGTGFDRGHLCPSGDRVANVSDNAATFLLSNIIPQAPQLNQGIWVELEDYARTLVAAGNELYIIAGGYGSGGTGSQGGTTFTLAGGALTVPARLWKVLVILPNGDNDIARVSASTRVIAVDIPNTQAASALPWGDYRTTVDAIEASAGLNLLDLLPATVQDDLESAVDTGPTQ